VGYVGFMAIEKTVLLIEQISIFINRTSKPFYSGSCFLVEKVEDIIVCKILINLLFRRCRQRRIAATPPDASIGKLFMISERYGAL